MELKNWANLAICCKIFSFQCKHIWSNWGIVLVIAPQKRWKIFFISSKKLFSFLRCSNFCIFIFPSFFPVSHCFRGWFKNYLKVCDVINCLNKNLITHHVWYLEKEIRCDIETLSIDRELNKGHFYGKVMQKMCTKS